MSKKNYKQSIRLDAKTASITAHLEDVLIDGFLEVKSVTAEQTKGGEARPDFLRCVELFASITAEKLTEEVRRRQAERGENKVEIETIKFVEDHIEVTATYRGMSLPITVSARVNPCLDEYGCITVNLLPLDGALGWLTLPLAKIAAQAARQDRKVADLMVIREIDNDSIRLALRMDRSAVILPNLKSIDIEEGELHIRCEDCSQANEDTLQLLDEDELQQPTLSAECVCATCEGVNGPKPIAKEQPQRANAEQKGKEEGGWFSSLSSLYNKVVSSDTAEGGDETKAGCQRSVEDFIVLERYEEALSLCEKELSSPTLLKKDEPRLQRRRMAILLEGLKDGEKALLVSKETIEKFPNEPYFHEAHAKSLSQSAKVKEAIVYLEKQAEVAQEDKGAYLACRYLGAATTLAISGEDSLKKAETLIPAIETMGGKSGRVAHLKGELARKRGDLALASQWFEQTLNSAPFRVESLRCLGRTLAARHLPLAARAVWSTILLLRPYDGEACRFLGVSPGGLPNRKDDFTKLDEDDLVHIIDWSSGLEGNRLTAAQNLIEQLAPAIPILVDEKPLLPHGSQSISPKEEESISRAFNFAKTLLPEFEGIIIYKLPDNHRQIISGMRWIAFPTKSLQGLDHHSLVFLSLRELVRQRQKWPRLDDGPIVPSLITCLARRVAAEGVKMEDEEGFISDVITSHIGANGSDLHDGDLNLWLRPERRDEFRPVCSRFVSLHCNPCDINNVMESYEWTLDRVAFVATGSLATASYAILAPYLDKELRKEAKRIGPVRLLAQLLDEERKKGPKPRLKELEALARRLIQLCRFGRRVDNVAPKKSGKGHDD